MSTREPLRGAGRRETMPAMRVLLVLATSAMVMAGCAGRTDELPELGQIPTFRLVERSGRPFGSSDLTGRVWIAGFIFTRCPDVCPAVTAEMRRLRGRLGDDPAVSLVSISVDPSYDTPERLSAYAREHRVTEPWYFLTGSADEVRRVLAEGFRVAFGTDGPPGSPITHSDRLVLVDHKLRIRGYYRGRDADDVDRLLVHARRLAAETGSGEAAALAWPIRRLPSA